MNVFQWLDQTFDKRCLKMCERFVCFTAHEQNTTLVELYNIYFAICIRLSVYSTVSIESNGFNF